MSEPALEVGDDTEQSTVLSVLARDGLYPNAEEVHALMALWTSARATTNALGQISEARWVDSIPAIYEGPADDNRADRSPEA